MSSTSFAFKQFVIQQEKCAMKVGTDAVLLGSWIDCEKAENILDIGTGTGIIALMLAQRSRAFIEAIDIDKNAYQQALENVEKSKWAERINVIHSSLQDFVKNPRTKYDLIVTNPPYFVGSSKALDLERTTARHADLLTTNDIIDGVKKLLTPSGKFCMILPVKEGELFRGKAESQGLKLSKLLRVRTTEDKKTEKRLLMQFEFEPTSFNESSLVIEKDQRHSYTEEYKELTKEYYLNF